MNNPLQNYEVIVFGGMGDVQIYLVDKQFHRKHKAYLENFDAEGVNRSDDSILSEFLDDEAELNNGSVIDYNKFAFYYMV